MPLQVIVYWSNTVEAISNEPRVTPTLNYFTANLKRLAKRANGLQVVGYNWHYLLVTTTC